MQFYGAPCDAWQCVQRIAEHIVRSTQPSSFVKSTMRLLTEGSAGVPGKLWEPSQARRGHPWCAVPEVRRSGQ